MSDSVKVPLRHLKKGKTPAKRCPHAGVVAELHAGNIVLACPECGTSLHLRQAEVLDAYREQIAGRVGIYTRPDAG